MDQISVVLYAYGGGIALKLIELVEISRIPKFQRPPTFSDWLFVLLFFCLPALGPLIAIAYSHSATPLTPILTLQIGASAPVIFKSFSSAVPRTGEQKIG